MIRRLSRAARSAHGPQGLMPSVLVARLITSPSPTSSWIKPGSRTWRGRGGWSECLVSIAFLLLRSAVVERSQPGDKEGELLGDVDPDEEALGHVGLPVRIGEDDIDDVADRRQTR